MSSRPVIALTTRGHRRLGRLADAFFTDQHAVAEVVIVISGTLTVLGAVARVLARDAFAKLTAVSQRTFVAVIARLGFVLELTALDCVTAVTGAGVVIIAVQGHTDAHCRRSIDIAVVQLSALVSVVTRH